MRKFFILLLLFLPLPVVAHNVVGGVYAVGDMIEGEVGFSDGKMAQAGTLVIVTDAKGNKLGETLIKEEGGFAFKAAKRIDHYFKIDMGSGHIFKTVLPLDELPESLDDNSSVAQYITEQPSGSTMKATTNSELQQIIEQAVAKQIKPLRKELKLYKEKASLQDVLGGVGYIFGLCGVAIWLRQRKLKARG